MISLVSLMWATALFFAMTGAIRGWRRELIGGAGILLGFFTLFQFDSLLRGSLYLLLTDEQTFLLQAAAFLAIAALVFRSQLARQTQNTGGIRQSLIGAAVGFFNGYLVAGSIWYFLDINRYPFAQLVSAPADGSVGFAGVSAMPILALGGGLTGSGDLLALVVLVVLGFVVMVY